MSIKNLKPRNCGFKQGYFDGANPLKYVGPRPIVFRSGLEYKFMLWCEKTAEVIQWSSEPFSIPYVGDDNKTHKYWIDFVIKMKDGITYLIEVKPLGQVPLNEAQINLNPVMRKNALKWNAVLAYCRVNPGVKFKIITEKFLK